MFNIKVLHVISGNDFGGAANHVMNVCSAPEGQFKATICCIGDGELYDNAVNKGLGVIKYSFKDIINGKLKDYAKTASIDIINYHGAKANFTYLFTKKQIKIPAVVTVHSDYRYDFKNNKIKFVLYTPLSILALKKFKHYICASQSIKNLLEIKRFKGDKFLVNNAIPSSDKDKLKTNIRESYNISDSDFVYIMIARMHPVKNHKGLISAFKKLRNEFLDVKLILVGDGSLEDSLRIKVKSEGLEDCVIFSGSKVNVIDFLKNCNISILTSFSEGGFPLVILESGMAKRPVICSRVGDLEDIINDELGYLVDPFCIEDIYSKMKLAYMERNMLEEMGLKLHNLVLDKYSLESFWTDYFKIYEHLLKISN